MSRYWSPFVHKLEPYIPGEQPRISNLIKINTNENPYPPSPRVAEAITHELGKALGLYPDPLALALREKLADYHGLSVEQIFVGNGSDEVLAHAFNALLRHNRPVMFPDITYSFYAVYCQLYGIETIRPPLNEQLEIELQDYIKPHDKENQPLQLGGIIIANPNAPTGQTLTLEAIRRLLEARPDIPIIVDEAYADFSDVSVMPLIAEFDNLLVIHTFSKSRALAGMRIGAAFGHPDLIHGLVRVKDSFNSYPLSRLAMTAAIASLDDEEYFQEQLARIIKTRTELSQNLRRIGFEVLPSGANFIFARHPNHAGAKVAAFLRERAILVRHFAKPRIADFVRITIGTEQECTQLFHALQEL